MDNNFFKYWTPGLFNFFKNQVPFRQPKLSYFSSSKRTGTEGGQKRTSKQAFHFAGTDKWYSGTREKKIGGKGMSAWMVL